MATNGRPVPLAGKRGKGTKQLDRVMRWSFLSTAGHEPAADLLISPDDWADLNPNDRVIIQKPGEVPVPATIDIVAPAADTLWVWQDNGLGRIVLHELDHVRVWKSGQTAYPAERPSLPVYNTQGRNLSS